MAALTKKQKKVLDFIGEFIERRGYSPSVEEIAEGVGLRSKATVHGHLTRLREKGFIRALDNRARSVEVVSFGSKRPRVVEAPLLGIIAAGKPIEAVEDRDTISLPEELIGRGETFVLRVSGDSMIDDHILDGDYVIVERRDTADNGDTVVALIDGAEATVKRFHARGGKIVLEPRNPSMSPMEFEPGRVTIQGVVTGILRRMY